MCRVPCPGGRNSSSTRGRACRVPCPGGRNSSPTRGRACRVPCPGGRNSSPTQPVSVAFSRSLYFLTAFFRLFFPTQKGGCLHRESVQRQSGGSIFHPREWGRGLDAEGDTHRCIHFVALSRVQTKHQVYCFLFYGVSVSRSATTPARLLMYGVRAAGACALI